MAKWPYSEERDDTKINAVPPLQQTLSTAQGPLAGAGRYIADLYRQGQGLPPRAEQQWTDAENARNARIPAPVVAKSPAAAPAVNPAAQDRQTRFNNLVGVAQRTGDAQYFPKQEDFPDEYAAYIANARKTGAPAPAPAPAAKSGGSSRNRVAQLQAEPEAPVGPAMGDYDKANNVFYHGNGRWYSDAPPSEEDARNAAIISSIASELKRADPYGRLGDHAKIIENMAQTATVGKYGLAAKEIEGQYGLQREGVQGEYGLQRERINTGPQYANVAAQKEIAQKNIDAGRFERRTPVSGDVVAYGPDGRPELDATGGTRYIRGLIDQQTGQPVGAYAPPAPKKKSIAMSWEQWFPAAQKANPGVSAEALRKYYDENRAK
jgi:hypothetical protein